MQQSELMNQRSIASTFKLLDSPVRNNIINLLYSLGSASFKTLGQKLDMERAGLAYHIKLLKNAGLIENFYSNRENSRAYSYYSLTDFARWLITHDVNMTLESQQYIQDVTHSKEKGMDDPRQKEQSSRNSPGRKKVFGQGTFNIIDEQIKIKKDPRVRLYDYKIYLKQ